MRASEAVRLLPTAQPNTTQFDRQFRAAMRDLRILRDLRPLSTGLDSIPVPVAASIWQDDGEENKNSQ